MKIRLLISIFILFLVIPNETLAKSIKNATRLANKSLKTSVIIPCQIKHVQHLDDLLLLYTQQTRLPDEIVVSVSEITDEGLHSINTIKNQPWPFKLNIITSKNVLYAGQNRNVACAQAIGDIFICQDADDIPHPQRIEIIAYFFEHHNIDHIAHTFTIQKRNPELNVRTYIPNQIKFVNPRDYKAAWNMQITNGNVSISRKLFNSIKWPADKIGQDVKFNNLVYQKFKTRIVLPIPLICYRIYLSSHAKPSPTKYSNIPYA